VLHLLLHAVRQLIHALLEAHLFQAHAASHHAVPSAIQVIPALLRSVIILMAAGEMIIMIIAMF